MPLADPGDRPDPVNVGGSIVISPARLEEVTRGLGAAQAEFVTEPLAARWIDLCGARTDYLAICGRAALQLAGSEEGTANELLSFRDRRLEGRHKLAEAAIAKRSLSRVKLPIPGRHSPRTQAKTALAASADFAMTTLTAAFDDKLVTRNNRDDRLRGYQIDVGAALVLACITSEVEAEALAVARYGLTRKNYDALREVGVPLPEVS